MKALSWDGHSGLKEASDEIKNDKEVVLAALQMHGAYLEYASEELKQDRNVVLAAIKSFRFVFDRGWVSEALKDDKEFMLSVLQQDGNPRIEHYGSLLQFASDRLKNDRDIVLAAIKKEGLALEYAAQVFKNDNEIVLTAVRQDGYALMLASAALKGNKEIVLAAVLQNGCALQYASDALKNEKEIVLSAVQQDGYALCFASDLLKNDKDIVRAALQNYDKALYFASEQLKKDPEFLNSADMQCAAEIPLFKYHPYPLKTGETVGETLGCIKKSDAKCACCNQQRGYLYVGFTYLNEDDVFCPWCIADGTAAKGGVLFKRDTYSLRNVSKAIRYEVQYRTPAFSTCQESDWLAHCKDACEYHGLATLKHLRALTPAQKADLLKELDWDEDYWSEVLARYGEEEGHMFDPDIHLFLCRHCKKELYLTDYT